MADLGETPFTPEFTADELILMFLCVTACLGGPATPVEVALAMVEAKAERMGQSKLDALTVKVKRLNDQIGRLHGVR